MHDEPMVGDVVAWRTPDRWWEVSTITGDAYLNWILSRASSIKIIQHCNAEITESDK